LPKIAKLPRFVIALYSDNQSINNLNWAQVLLYKKLTLFASVVDINPRQHKGVIFENQRHWLDKNARFFLTELLLTLPWQSVPSSFQNQS
jgi:hypothetical protein